MMGIAARLGSNGRGSFAVGLSACRALAVLAVLGGLLFSGTSAVAQGVADDLQEAYKKYAAGDTTEALELFEKAFAQNPSNDALFGFVEKVRYATLHRMLSDEDPRIAGIALAILKGAQAGHQARESDAEGIQQAIDQVLGADGVERLRLMVEYTHKYGRNLVPGLVPVLGDSEIDNRTTAIRWITRIGRDALPPLAVAWKHSEPRVRTNVAELMGVASLRHVFSLAYLKALMETEKIDEVRRAAQRSFDLILAEYDADATDDAKVYFLRNANRLYLSPYDNPFANARYAPVVYRLVNDRVVGTRVARFQLSGRMATQALEEALALDPDYLPALVLTLCNDCAQLVEYDQNLALYSKQDGYEDVKQILASQVREIEYVLRLRTLAMAPTVLFEGLKQSLVDGRPEVAQSIIEVMLQRGLQGEVPESLVEALVHPDSKLVRIVAAIALAYWNPSARFDRGSDVVATLSEAVVQSGVRTVIKAMGNRALANRFDAVFRKLNMESYFRLDNVADAYAEALRLPPDAIVMDQSLQLESASGGLAPVNVFINELRKNYRTADVPVVVVVDRSKLKEATDLYASDERKVWVVPDDITPATLDRTVFRTAFSSQNDSKNLATRLAAAAAQALAHLAALPPGDFPVAESVKSLERILGNRPDVVRIPAIRALNQLGAVSAVPELAQVFADTENSVEARSEAMRAVSRILTTSGRAPPDRVVSLIINAASREGNLELRRAAWMALASGNIPADEYLAVIFSAAPAAGPAAAPSGAAEEAAEDEEMEEDDAEAEDEEELDLDDEGDEGDDEDLDLDDEEFDLDEDE